MIGHARDGHVPASDPHDPLDHADVDAATIEDGALLDVELEEACDGPGFPLGFVQPVRVAAEASDAVTDGVPRGCGELELERLHAADQGSATCLSRFFVLEDEHLEGVA